MSASDGAKPPAAWLSHLHDAGDWQRLILVAADSLAVDPNDPETHRHIAWAYASTDRLPEMRPHVDFLLESEPEEARNHHLAAVYFLDSKQHKQAERHIDTMLRQNPHSATYHYLACIYHLRCNRLGQARLHIAQARALAPSWAPAAHLEIRMDGVRQTKAREAWARIQRLEETLALDPEDADVMGTMGEIFLHELEQPREAERWLRQALAIEPGNRRLQGHLLDAIRARSLLYRTLSLPETVLRRTIKAVREGRIRWFFLVLAIKPLLAVAAWLLLVGFFFTPGAKIFEWFVLADIARSRPTPRWLAPLTAALAWPLWLRMAVCLGMIGAAWLLFGWKVCRFSPSTSLQIIGWVFGSHFGLVCLLVGFRKMRAKIGRWQDARRQHREMGQDFSARDNQAR